MTGPEGTGGAGSTGGPAPGTAAREEIFARIRRATAGGPAATVTARRDYRVTDDRSTPDLLDLLTERLRDYRSSVRRTDSSGLAATISEALADRGARRVAVPPGLDLAGLGLPGPGHATRGADGSNAGQSGAGGRGAGKEPPAGGAGSADGTEFVVDDGLSPAELDRLDGVLTTAALAIAETGTIVLDGQAGQGRRALTLIPDYHLCVLSAAQVVGLVPEAIARLDPARPLTWISGPSATSDIELSRVEGVHGPRTLEVILVGPGGRTAPRRPGRR